MQEPDDPHEQTGPLGPRAIAVGLLVLLALLVLIALAFVLASSDPAAPTEAPRDPPPATADRSPPSLTVDRPPSPIPTDLDRGTIEGRVSDPSGPVVLRVDGRPVFVGKDGRFSADVDLFSGENAFTLTAEDALGNRASASQTLYRTPTWFVRLDPKRRAPLPLPNGLSVSRESGDYRNALDGSLLRWVWVPTRTERLFRTKAGRVLFSHGYFVGKNEVTWEQYLRFCKEVGRAPPKTPRWGINPEHPVCWVTWDDAGDYCRWARLRLPTEAEWQHAALGTGGGPWPWGESTRTDALANVKEDAAHTDGFRYTSPVGSFPAGASPFGCLDMAGNVFEWVSDLHAKLAASAELLVDPQGPATGDTRVTKGGGYDNPLSVAKGTGRWGDPPKRAMAHRGFRAARSAD